MSPSGVFATSVENIDWQQTNPDGTKSVTLVGSREPGVSFTYAFFVPAGVWDAPHSHIAAAHRPSPARRTPVGRLAGTRELVAS